MKRNYVGKFCSLVFFAVLTVGIFCFSSCVKKTVDPVAITASKTVAENTTLLQLMEDMESENELSFSIKNGMVEEINGVKNTTNSFWMLYTSDEASANTAWGTYEYNGETLGRAVVGATDLIVGANEVYVWVYQTF